MNTPDGQETENYGFIDELKGMEDFSKEDLDFLQSYENDQLPNEVNHEQDLQAEQNTQNQQTNGQEAGNQGQTNEQALLDQQGSSNDQIQEGDEEDQGGEGENRNKMVTHGAFHKERELRKQAQEKIDNLQNQYESLQQQFTVGNERLRMVTELIQAQQQQQELQKQAQAEIDNQPPNKEEDLLGYMEWQEKKIAELQGTQQKAFDEIEDTKLTFQQQQQQQHLVSAYQSDARNFISQTPDFADAYRHAMVKRDKDLQIMGYKNPNDRAQILQNEEMSLAQNLLQQGRSPAEVIYNWAKEHGYQPQSAEQAINTADQQNGQQPAVQQNTQVAANQSQQIQQSQQMQGGAMDKVAQLQNGQAASKSLSSAGGGEAETMTIDTLANMSEQEFDAFMASKEGEVHRLLGRTSTN